MKLRSWLCAALLSLSLSACGEDTVGVPVSGINYTDQGFGAYGLKDPNDEKNYGGGEPLGPYSAGGMMCCYSLPEQWHEGLQVGVVIRRSLQGETSDERTQDYVERKKNGTLYETILVDVPPYDAEDIQRSAIWVEMLPDDRFEVVVSPVDPKHEDWPGMIKGGPVPSDEYRRKIIDQRLQEAKGRLERRKIRVGKVENHDTSELEDDWNFYNRFAKEDIENFSGYDDPKFRSFLLKEMKSAIESDESMIHRLEEARP